MSFVELVLLSLGLAVDACCLCTIIGLVYQPLRLETLKLSAPFGILQGAMPFIGYVGIGFLPLFILEQSHWIAFILLLALGSKMIYEALKGKEEVVDTTQVVALSAASIFLQSISTSIDALAIGVTFYNYSLPQVLFSISIIALITYLACILSISLGRKIGGKFNGRAEILGGIVLILLGAKFLFDGLS